MSSLAQDASPKRLGGPALRSAWNNLKARQKGLRARDSAEALGVSEAELIASLIGEGATRLRTDGAKIIKDLPSLGPAMALTRNAACVHEKIGPYTDVSINPGHGLVVSSALGVPARGAQVSEKLKKDMAAIEAAVARANDRPRVLFLMGQGPGGIQAAGTGTPADAIITMAKATNIATFEGYKPFTREAAAALAPEVILVADFSAQALGGIDVARNRPEFMLTPAGRNGRVVVADTMMLLGFGPRTPEGLAWLAKLLHPNLAIPAIARAP